MSVGWGSGGGRTGCRGRSVKHFGWSVSRSSEWREGKAVTEEAKHAGTGTGEPRTLLALRASTLGLPLAAA